MAPSANRRPGFSRRAQYGTFIGYAAGLLGALVGAFALGLSIVNPAAFAGLRGVAANAATPGGLATAETRVAGRGLLSGISAYFAAGSQNVRLKRELRESRSRLAEAEAVAAENRRLKAMLGLAHGGTPPVAVAKLTSSTASSTRRFATISAGAADGVATGMPVRSTEGLIGRVLEVGSHTSRVLLVTDTESIVPVRRSRDGLPAFAQGRGDGSIKIRLINLGVNAVRKGDVFVTSGSGGLYRPGTAIAVAVRLTNDGAIGRVLSDPAATEYVVVERTWVAQPPEIAGAGAAASSQPQEKREQPAP